MDLRERYSKFCNNNYVPIYSEPWYMDLMCGKDNWDVWLYDIEAAMPYYMENRAGLKYITKPPIPLSQNNGIIFRENGTRGIVREAEFQQRVIDEACNYIRSLGVDVYEQQYQTTFTNWLPFYWNGYSNILRYTYVIDTSDMEKVYSNISSKCKRNIKKGESLTHISFDISAESFYDEHMKVFKRQNKKLPYTKEFWIRYVDECEIRGRGKRMCAYDDNNNVCAVLFLIWDDRRMYHICGGYVPEFSSTQAYSALTFHGLKLAHDKKLLYDFEGSVIKNISVAMREYGGVPVPYYRIRKVFNPTVVLKEANDYIDTLDIHRIKDDI